MSNFASAQELNQWLLSHGIDTSEWGKHATKPVDSLWSEIVRGESQLQENPPGRVTHIVEMIIRDDDRILIEGEQQLGENQQRYRGRPPGEKIKPDEPPLEAALRGLEEELQVKRIDVEILKTPREPKKTSLESPSYPALKTIYIVYTVEVKISGLPKEDFSTPELSHNEGDPVTIHYWHWESINDPKWQHLKST